MKIFVTGGAGFIGSNFIHYVLGLGQGHRIVNFDKLTYAGNLANLEGVADDRHLCFVHGDICDPAAAETAMQGCEVAVHFAAESHVDRSIYEPAAVVETNVTGTFVLLQVARKLGIRRYVHISTDEVYGDIPAGEFACENSPLRPSSPYSASKAASDLLVLSYVRTYAFPAVITRSSNNYGPYQFPEKFLPLIITNALDGKPLPIYGDGKQQREWLHVLDNCRGILAALERGRVGEIYNLGSQQVEENIGVARRVLRETERADSLLAHVTDRPGHDRRYALLSAKATSELGWAPQISLDEGLRETIAWYRDNSKWLEAVRGGEYRSYYEKYYENRDASLRAIASSSAGASDPAPAPLATRL